MATSDWECEAMAALRGAGPGAGETWSSLWVHRDGRGGHRLSSQRERRPGQLGTGVHMQGWPQPSWLRWGALGWLLARCHLIRAQGDPAQDM